MVGFLLMEELHKKASTVFHIVEEERRIVAISCA